MKYIHKSSAQHKSFSAAAGYWKTLKSPLKLNQTGCY